MVCCKFAVNIDTNFVSCGTRLFWPPTLRYASLSPFQDPVNLKMTILSSTQRIIQISLAGGLALGLATLSGCGIGKLDNSNSPLVTPAFTGKTLGGQMPIVGATVKIYATTSNGYGVATMLQEATQRGTSAGQDTDAGGNFSFAGGYTCPAGQFVYVVSSGGNTGANAVNPNAVLVAALGRCEDLYVNTTGGNYNGPTTYINELTTVAAAYALGNFSSVTGSGAATSVLIGAPATNNAGQISGVSTGCIANGTTCNTTAAAGLAHAFLNASNLVNPFVNTSITGANAKLPGNSAAVVPQELIDSLGNILVSCVNSTGGTAGDSSGSNCTQLFTATTIGSNIPNNTFSAMVNLAANPTLGGSVTAVANLYALATPQTSVYSPALISAPVSDFSIGINYPSGLGASTASAHLATCATDPCQGLSYSASGAVDINDVFYAGNSSASGTTPVNIFSFSSNGTLLSNSSNTTFKSAFGVSVDGLGNGYFTNGSGSGTTALGVFKANGGVITATPYAVSVAGVKVYATAVDRANNVWVLGAGTSGSTLYMSTPAPATGTCSTCTGEAAIAVTVPSSPGLIGLSIDPSQNVWTANSNALLILQNTGTLAAPTYATSSLLTASPAPSGNPVVGITFAGNPYVAYASSYTPVATAGVQAFTPTLNGPEVTGVTAGTLTNASSKITGTVDNEADGAGNIWLADTNSHTVIEFAPAAGTANRYIPCLGGNTTCASIFGSAGKPFEVSIDSTGSIWVNDPAGSNIVQIIGAAAPTWPLLSLGLTGKP